MAIEELIRQAYDIVGEQQPTNEELQNIICDLRKAVKLGKLNRLFCRIKEREMFARCPKKLRRAWKNYKRKYKKYDNEEI